VLSLALLLTLAGCGSRPNDQTKQACQLIHGPFTYEADKLAAAAIFASAGPDSNIEAIRKDAAVLAGLIKAGLRAETYLHDPVLDAAVDCRKIGL
jgi:hypothetical protein